MESLVRHAAERLADLEREGHLKGERLLAGP